MNFSLNVAYKVEQRVAQIERHDGWTDRDESAACAYIFDEVIKEVEGTLAFGDIRIGDIILIVDCDTRVPEDCLLDAATEFHESRDVAIIQHKSSGMRVVHNYWANGILYLTQLIYAVTTYAAAAGKMGPFLGHNAFIRWSLLNKLSWVQDGQMKWWSEVHVSEDLELSLRLQIAGWRVRYVTYCGDGFQEGVSFTVYDELRRWQKHCYGLAELLLHPLKEWRERGPLTPLCIAFLRSNTKLASKFILIASLGTYCTAASGWIYVLINYFFGGRYPLCIIQYYIDNLITIASVVIMIYPLVRAIYRHYWKGDSFGVALVENYIWTGMLIIFVGAFGTHLSWALLCHFVSIDIRWDATPKELQWSNSWKEFRDTIARFKWMYVAVVAGIALMLLFAFTVPVAWQIRGFSACLPLGLMLACHLLLPIASIPNLMAIAFG